MSDSQATQPVDSAGRPYERAMGVPICSVAKIGGAQYRDIFDLTQYGGRVFTGISIFNPDGSNYINIAIGSRGCGASKRCIKVQPNGFLTFDQQSFGGSFMDQQLSSVAKRVRALLVDAADAAVASGTAATGTINYHNGGSVVQPADGDTVTVNGNVYEFSNDLSVTPGRIKVDIGATADLSWTALVTAVNANDSELVATINTGTDIVTLTSNLGGTDGNAQTFTGTSTGVVFSGSGNLASGANGLQPIIHIW